MATIIKAKGGNKSLNLHAREEFQKAKKLGRKKPAQVWVWDEPVQPEETDDRKGHWTKGAK